MKHISFQATGTVWEIDIYDEVSITVFDNIHKRSVEMVHAFEMTYSRFKKNSLVSSLSQKTGVFDVPEDFTKILSIYRSLERITNGVFTPFIGHAMEKIGYRSDYVFSRLSSEEMHVPRFDEAMTIVDLQTVKITQPVLFDMGAVGKGYLIDLVSRFILDMDVHHFIINAGGDMYMTSKIGKSFKIGLESPHDPKRIIGLATLKNRSVAGSSGNRRRFNQHHHIVDPSCNTSPESIQATWAVADQAAWADALSTCLYFIKPGLLREKLAHTKDTLLLVLDENMDFETSPELDKEDILLYR